MECKFNIITIEADTLSELTDKVNAVSTNDGKIVKAFAFVVTETCDNFPVLYDRNGNRINNDDVIYGYGHFFRIYWDGKHKCVEAISPTFGYLCNADTEDYTKYERIGTYSELGRMLEILYETL